MRCNNQEKVFLCWLLFLSSAGTVYVRCHTIQMTSWCNVTRARTGMSSRCGIDEMGMETCYFVCVNERFERRRLLILLLS